MGYFIYGFTVEGYNAWAADRLQKMNIPDLRKPEEPLRHFLPTASR